MANAGPTLPSWSSLAVLTHAKPPRQEPAPRRALHTGDRNAEAVTESVDVTACPAWVSGGHGRRVIVPHQEDREGRWAWHQEGGLCAGTAFSPANCRRVTSGATWPSLTLWAECKQLLVCSHPQTSTEADRTLPSSRWRGFLTPRDAAHQRLRGGVGALIWGSGEPIWAVSPAVTDCSAGLCWAAATRGRQRNTAAGGPPPGLTHRLHPSPRRPPGASITTSVFQLRTRRHRD